MKKNLSLYEQDPVNKPGPQPAEPIPPATPAGGSDPKPARHV